MLTKITFTSPTSIKSGLCPMAAIPCSAFTSATSTLCNNFGGEKSERLKEKFKYSHNGGDSGPTLTLHTVCPCSLTCSQLEITCSIWVRSKKSSCSSSGMSWLNSMVSSTLSNFRRTERGEEMSGQCWQNGLRQQLGYIPHSATPSNNYFKCGTNL